MDREYLFRVTGDQYAAIVASLQTAKILHVVTGVPETTHTIDQTIDSLIKQMELQK
jgi:hypothetical protein